MSKLVKFLRSNENCPRVIAVIGLVTMFYGGANSNDSLDVFHVGVLLCVSSFVIVYWQAITSWKCELDSKEADNG